MSLALPTEILTGPDPAAALIVGGVNTYRTGAVVRRISGADMPTIEALYDVVADAWDFPEQFGFNKDAFDDSIRDLPYGLHTATGARASGFLTVIADADQFLLDASADDFAWFANSPDFWREAYRGDNLGFGVVLLVESEESARLVADRWEAADAPLKRLRQD